MTDNEQAFWDACVVSQLRGVGSYLAKPQSVADAADALLTARRKKRSIEFENERDVNDKIAKTMAKLHGEPASIFDVSKGL